LKDRGCPISANRRNDPKGKNSYTAYIVDFPSKQVKNFHILIFLKFVHYFSKNRHYVSLLSGKYFRLFPTTSFSGDCTKSAPSFCHFCQQPCDLPAQKGKGAVFRPPLLGLYPIPFRSIS
jgi:hypothetical protein